MSLQKESAKPQFEDILTGDELKNVRKYVLSKDELQKPRELADEEKDRIASRRNTGWSWFDPTLDTEKRDVVQHIQNPMYRAGVATLGSSLPSALMGAYVGTLSKLMARQAGIKSKGLLTNPMVYMPLLMSIPTLLTARQKYERQKLYNDISEEYVKHHPEGAIESFPTVLRAMTEKRKAVNSLQTGNKKVKSAGIDYGKVEDIAKYIDTVGKTLNKVQLSFGGIAALGEALNYAHNRKDLDDIRERFKRRLKNKAEAEVFVSKVRMPLFRKGLTTEDKMQKFDDLFKESADKSPLLPHQQRVIDRLQSDDQPGLILMHGLGSGKTRSSIEAYKSLGLPAEVLLPAALKGNYEKELKKWVGKVPKDLHIRSQQDASRKGVNPEDFKDKLMIIDEAHRLRNEDTKLYKNLKDVQAKKRILLTGTPIYNDPSDIAKLINIAAGKQIMPERKPEFYNEYIQQKTVFPSIVHRMLGVKPGQELSVKNKDYLRKVFHKLIDYHAGNAEGFPTMDKETVRVPMAEKQQEIYKALMKDLPWYLRMKVSAGLPPDKKELDKLIPFLSGARMISNSTQGFTKDDKDITSPKIEHAFKFLKNKIDEDPSYKGLIYSNYLNSGVDPYKKMLQGANIPFGEFTGEIKDTVRNQLVKDYNENKLKALIISSAGGEGLDLKGTRLVQLLEPHFNNEKIKQVIGRAARYKSHEGLAPDKQKVLVQNYLSSLTPSTLDKLMHKKNVSTDEYLQNLADEKEKLNEEFIKLIRD